MKITYKGDYALKAVLDLALHHGNELVTIHEIARRIDAPVKFLEQILVALKKGGLVESRRGNVGGYLLSRPPDKITVGDVVRLIDGPIEPIPCVKAGYSNCSDIERCVLKSLWQRVSSATSKIVDNTTFEDLVSEVNAGHEIQAYSI